MSGRALHALIFFGIGLNSAVLANILIYVMLVRINRRLPTDRQISYLAYGMGRVQREYKRLYPGSFLYVFLWLCGGICVISMLLVAASLGFLGGIVNQ